MLYRFEHRVSIQMKDASARIAFLYASGRGALGNGLHVKSMLRGSKYRQLSSCYWILKAGSRSMKMKFVSAIIILLGASEDGTPMQT